jgi:signal transduction histidine kinase
MVVELTMRTTWLSWLLSLIWCCLMWTPTVAVADLVTSREQWKDVSALATVETAAEAHFEPAPELIAQGYTGQALWLRLLVQPLSNSAGEPVMLRIRPTILDSVQLWERNAHAPGGWRLRSSGDRQPFDASERSYSTLGFVIFPQTGGSEYLLRVVTTSTMLVHAEALPLAESNRKDARWALLHLLNLTIVGGILVWSLYAWRIERLALAGWFAAYQVSNIAYVLLVMGFIAALEPAYIPGFVDKMTGITVILTHMLGLWLNRQLLGAYGASSWALRGLGGLTILACMALVSFVLGWHRWALQMNMSLVLLTGAVTPLIVFSLKERPPLLPSLGLLRCLSLVLLLVLSLTILPLLGWLHAAEWSLHINLLHGLLASSIMSAILWQHARLRRIEQRRQQTEMLRLQIQVEAERKLAEDHRQFIDMLTHEIKTPLGIALISMGALKSDSPYIGRIDRALRDINAVVDRSRLSDLAEHKRLQPSWEQCAPRELLFECAESSTAPERLKVFAGETPEVRTDSGLLRIIINNLLDNALKYSPPESPIDVRMQARSDGVWLTVSNQVGSTDGPDPHRLFSKYYRAPSAQAKSGSGLGLYLSLQLAKLLDAKLQYSPQAGRVEFNLCLPI